MYKVKQKGVVFYDKGSVIVDSSLNQEQLEKLYKKGGIFEKVITKIENDVKSNEKNTKPKTTNTSGKAAPEGKTPGQTSTD